MNEIERAGIPAVIITALPKIGENLGTHRVVKSSFITSPTGDPGVTPEEEISYRKELLRLALQSLTTQP